MEKKLDLYNVVTRLLVIAYGIVLFFGVIEAYRFYVIGQYILGYILLIFLTWLTVFLFEDYVEELIELEEES